jgi:hypothetical protein
MAQLLTRALVLSLLLSCGACSSEKHSGPYFEPGRTQTDAEFGCTQLCCREKALPCQTDADGTCPGCEDRCKGACADANPVIDCMNKAGATFVCVGDGVVAPTPTCQQEYDDYQAALLTCGSSGAGGQTSEDTTQ